MNYEVDMTSVEIFYWEFQATQFEVLDINVILKYLGNSSRGFVYSVINLLSCSPKILRLLFVFSFGSFHYIAETFFTRISLDVRYALRRLRFIDVLCWPQTINGIKFWIAISQTNSKSQWSVYSYSFFTFV